MDGSYFLSAKWRFAKPPLTNSYPPPPNHRIKISGATSCPDGPGRAWHRHRHLVPPSSAEPHTSMDGDTGVAWDGPAWDRCGSSECSGVGEHMAAQVPAPVHTHMGETGNRTDPFQLAPSWLPCLFVFWCARLAGIFNI